MLFFSGIASPAPGQIVLTDPDTDGIYTGSHASGQSASQDYDHDGIGNGVEYFMGQTGSSFTSNPQLVNGLISWPHDANAVGVSCKVWTSENLADWTDVTGSTVDSGGFLSCTLPTALPRLFVRLEVTVP